MTLILSQGKIKRQNLMGIFLSIFRTPPQLRIKEHGKHRITQSPWAIQKRGGNFVGRVVGMFI